METQNSNNAVLRLLAYGLLLCVSQAVLQADQATLSEDDYLSEKELYSDFQDDIVVVRDPLEPVNRAIFKFNDFVYMNVLEHIAHGYQKVTPDPVERGASNFFSNLGYPVRLVGNLLQGRMSGAWVETERFAVNTTVGIVGIFPAADRYERMQAIQPEDVGQAFGAWGIGEGPYLVLPFLGPSNVRDLFGYVGDRTVNPLKKPYSLIEDSEWQLAFGVSEFVVQSPHLMRMYHQLKGGAIDPYSAMKNGYSQKRRSMIAE